MLGVSPQCKPPAPPPWPYALCWQPCVPPAAVGEGWLSAPQTASATKQTNVLQHAAMQIASEHSTFSPALIATPRWLRGNSSVCLADSYCPLIPLTPSVTGRKEERERRAGRAAGDRVAGCWWDSRVPSAGRGRWQPGWGLWWVSDSAGGTKGGCPRSCQQADHGAGLEASAGVGQDDMFLIGSPAQGELCWGEAAEGSLCVP